MARGRRFRPGDPLTADSARTTCRHLSQLCDEAVLAGQLGLGFVSTREHHFAADTWILAQLPVLSFTAARTPRLHLGTCLFLLPFHNPLRVVQQRR